MKRVMCCALCIIFLFASVSADISLLPTGKTIASTTQQIMVKPSVLVSIKSSAVPRHPICPVLHDNWLIQSGRFGQNTPKIPAETMILKYIRNPLFF